MHFARGIPKTNPTGWCSVENDRSNKMLKQLLHNMKKHKIKDEITKQCIHCPNISFRYQILAHKTYILCNIDKGLDFCFKTC